MDRSCHGIFFQGSPKISKDYQRIRANVIFISKSHKSRFNTELHNWQHAINIEQVWNDLQWQCKITFFCQESLSGAWHCSDIWTWWRRHSPEREQGVIFPGQFYIQHSPELDEQDSQVVPTLQDSSALFCLLPDPSAFHSLLWCDSGSGGKAADGGVRPSKLSKIGSSWGLSHRTSLEKPGEHFLYPTEFCFNHKVNCWLQSADMLSFYHADDLAHGYQLHFLS